MAYQPKSYRKFLVGAVSTAVVASSFAGVAGAASYSDVNSKYQEAVDFVVSKGIKGTSATTFGTYENIKRVDAAVFVAAVLGLNTTSAPDAGFTDVPQRAKGAVNALKAAGITSGKTATTFGAQDFITRGELAVWIQKGFKLEAGTQSLAFNDVASKYQEAVSALVSNGVTSGTSATTFGTYDNAKRGDFAIFLQRAEAASKKVPPIEKPSALTITGDSQGNKLTNGKSKLYTVKFTNPVSGKAIEGATLNVTFEENVGTDFGPERNATVTNAEGHAVTPYQANDGQEREVEIVTDKNGVATFEVTGSNTSVTPIVFLDGSYQEWDTKGGNPQIPNTQDNRFDKNTELYAKAATVTFGVTEYAIAVEGQRTNYAAISQDLRRGGFQHNGREYVITVKKPDGTAYAGGLVNVGIYQLLDGKLGNEPTAAYLYRTINKVDRNLEDTAAPRLNQTQGVVKLDNNGQAKVWLASTAVNDNAEPIVWVDQNTGTNWQGGTYEAGEPVSDNTKVDPTNFQNVRVDNLELGALLEIEENLVDGFQDFKLTLLNQSGKPFQPERAIDANVTFTIENTGTHAILIDTDHVSSQHITNTRNVDLSSTEHIIINVGGSLTISGHINDVNDALFSAQAPFGTTSLNVKTSAVIDDGVGYESQSVTVKAELNNTKIGFSYAADVEADAVDTDNANGNETVVLTFDKAVTGAEAGDFKIGTTKATSVTVDGRKVIVKFPDSIVGATGAITYDPNGAGGSVLVDEFGNKVIGFTENY
ncbi:S-layer homology domain-containing protein [Bacillus benzoevorans]|uniref:SLH domain-containing protein n=1 Tax=Bacillus benzoevorans TaxID=1456 RepID=A0A7X0HSI8_9BACI|nr:S-layer homology domain-containing protein [Bacillus benzoevorans]MBB6446074.1 hypothetical protein [Bacillus benzoevorans]